MPSKVKLTSDPPGVRYGPDGPHKGHKSGGWYPRKPKEPVEIPPDLDRETFLEAIYNEIATRDASTWIPRNFYLYDTAKLMELYECQARPLREALRRDDDGRYIYNTVLWSWPKKSAKSSVIAAVVEWTAMTRARSFIRLVANDLRQADSRVGMYLRESIKIKQQKMREGEIPMRDEVMDIKINPSGYSITFPNGSLIEMVPIDPSGEAGGNDDLIVYSELWGWKSSAHQRMWSEMTLSSTKYGYSQRWIDTYAGFSGESPILEQLYNVGVVQGERIWRDLEVWKNSTGRLLAVWVTKPMLPWQTSESGKEYYASEEASLAPNEFQRMHRNQWVSSTEAFVPEEWWRACKADSIPELTRHQEIVIGLDAAVSSDYFALVGISVEDSDTNPIQTVRFADHWEPPKNGKIIFDDPDNPNDPRTPAGRLRELCQRYNVVKVVYDPYQLHDMVTRLSREHIADFAAFDQGTRRTIADKHLYDIIRERRIRHSGQSNLTEHILNANQQADNEKLRIVKRAQHLKIDLSVAASMASHEAKRLNL